MLVDDGVYKWYVYAPLRELSIDTPADTTDASDRAFCLFLGVATQDKAQDIELLHRMILTPVVSCVSCVFSITSKASVVFILWGYRLGCVIGTTRLLTMLSYSRFQVRVRSRVVFLIGLIYGLCFNFIRQQRQFTIGCRGQRLPGLQRCQISRMPTFSQQLRLSTIQGIVRLVGVRGKSWSDVQSAPRHPHRRCRTDTKISTNSFRLMLSARVP